MPEAVSQDAASGGPKASSRVTSRANRFSIASTETGESSIGNSITVDNASSTVVGGNNSSGSPNPDHTTVPQLQDGRGSHRSHRSRGSASFLVSNAIFAPSTKTTDSREVSKPFLETSTHRKISRDQKGKVVVRSPEKLHKKNRASLGLGIGGSPLAATVTTAAIDQGEDPSQGGHNAAEDAENTINKAPPSDVPASAGLDVDSAQIVNLALNLSENRRNAARRNISSSMPPSIAGFGEGFAGSSLRQHLQAQRRTSRNISPKPERGAFTTSPRVPSGQRMESPLQAAFGTQRDGSYQYQFSASTLTRAEKAKKAIELMAQYRRLLQYVPPLKPQALSRVPTRSPPNSATGSPAANQWSHMNSANTSNAALGRPYNPLQYIRNRKVRNRERKPIDGEAQGFGDVEKVTSWVDRVASESNAEEYHASDCVLLPPFEINDSAVPAVNSPQTTLGRSQGNPTKINRPRVDWIIDPADMIADLYWLEQDENKRLIEDNRERKIFPQNAEFRRAMSRSSEEPEESELNREDPDKSLRLDIPKSNSLRGNPDRESDSARGRARQTLHNIAHLHKDLNRIGHEHHLFKSHHKSSSESSDSDDRPLHSRHRRSTTKESLDVNSDILEKQMLEILAKESRESGFGRTRDDSKRQPIQSVESLEPSTLESVEKSRYGSTVSGMVNFSHERRSEHHRKDSIASTGRASLEVPGHRTRSSLDGLDSTAPNSPQAKASNVASHFVPSIAIDLSPPPSRQSSPTRNPIAKVKSTINLFHDRSRNHSRGHSVTRSIRHESLGLEPEEEEKSKKAMDVPSTPDSARRTPSPSPKIVNRKTEDSLQPSSSKTSSLRRKVEDVPSGIKGLFKSGRNPVTRVSDLIWKKEASPSSAASSDTSTDESDLEDGEPGPAIAHTGTIEKPSNGDSFGVLSLEKEPKSYTLPLFTSSFERRGRSGAPALETVSPESDKGSQSQSQRSRDDRRLSRFQFLKPPRIDVQSASPQSSPDLPAADRSSRNSDVSDVELRRSSAYAVRGADTRLNAILGLPGHVGAVPPVTGLTHQLEGRHGSSASKRHWSITDRECSPMYGAPTKREIARVRALLLGSGIKAKEISRRATEVQDFQDTDGFGNTYSDVVAINRDPQLLKPVTRAQAHLLAAQILSKDIQLSTKIWQDSASSFSSQTITSLLDRVEGLQDRILGRDGLSEMTRKAEREADDVSRDLVTAKTMAVKELQDRMDRILRRRRRRFRWLRRAGWALLEWVLLGVMWWVWLVVVLVRFVGGTVRGVFGAVRWLLWL